MNMEEPQVQKANVDYLAIKKKLLLFSGKFYVHKFMQKLTSHKKLSVFIKQC